MPSAGYNILINDAERSKSIIKYKVCTDEQSKIHHFIRYKSQLKVKLTYTNGENFMSLRKKHLWSDENLVNKNNQIMFDHISAIVFGREHRTSCYSCELQ